MEQRDARPAPEASQPRVRTAAHRPRCAVLVRLPPPVPAAAPGAAPALLAAGAQHAAAGEWRAAAERFADALAAAPRPWLARAAAAGLAAAFAAQARAAAPLQCEAELLLRICSALYLL